MSTPSVLVVDDNRDLARGIALLLSDLTSDVKVAHSAEGALALLEERPVDLVLSDIRMPGQDGHSLLDCVRRRWPGTRVILFTGYGTIESAVDAMKHGAFDYLTKPFNNDELVLVARRALKEIADEAEIARLRAELRGSHEFHGIHSRDKRMVPLIEAIRRVAPTSASVLVSGESGTGKELVARAVHAESPRTARPFIAVNAAALPEGLAEAELFGAKKGAYTGADHDRRGLFEEADGGTLFIDEVASMPLGLQGKLLRALQEREVTPIGGGVPVKVDARIVAASNVDPRRLLKEGKLRSDLYYRLAVFRLSVPPLRERIEDINLLAGIFLERAARPGEPQRQLSTRALRLLLSYDWPGNVRELMNVMERAAVMARGIEVGPADIILEDDSLDWPSEETDVGLRYEEAKRRVIERFQHRYVERLLAEAEGNVSAAARRAGVTRAALHRIMRRLGIGGDDEADGRSEADEGGGET